MPTMLPSPPVKPFGGFRFSNNRSFADCLPFINEAECAIISAERAGYTFRENAKRTDALRVRLSDAFLRGKRSFVFDCRLIEGRSFQPREKMCRYVFVAEQPVFIGKPSISPFLERLFDLCGGFNKEALIFIPYVTANEERQALSLIEMAGMRPGFKLEELGAVTFDGGCGRISIGVTKKQAIFEVIGSSPIIMGSMNNAYLFRTLKAQDYPGKSYPRRALKNDPISPITLPRQPFRWSGECAPPKKFVTALEKPRLQAQIDGVHE